MTRLDGELDPEGGETFQTALRTYLDAEARSADPTDDRTPAQRRADALVEICRQWLDLADRPTVAGERPHVVLTVDAKVLAEYRARVEGDPPLARAPGAADRCELDHVGPVSPEVARRLSCDASVMRVVMAGMSEPLDVGRRTKVISPALRRAVTLRDRRCRFPECDRPATWCDCHHVVHWADDGPTALKNLVLLCRRHHRLIHRPRGFRLEIREGSPTFLRPDGSVLEDRAPP